MACLLSTSAFAQQQPQQRAWARCWAAGETMDNIARQRDLGLPAEAAQKITEMVWEGHTQGLTGWKNVVDLVYSQRLRTVGPGIIGAMIANQCIQEGARANRSAYQAIDPTHVALQARMVEVMRAATDDPKLGPNLDDRQSKIEERLEAILPQGPGETGDAWQSRIGDLSRTSMAPATERAQLDRNSGRPRLVRRQHARPNFGRKNEPSGKPRIPRR
jgi:hypothetical protein